MIAEVCQEVLHGFGMPAKWALSIVVPIFKGKGDIHSCSCHGSVELIEHGMKVVEWVLERRLRRIVTVDENNLVLCLREEQLMLSLS